MSAIKFIGLEWLSDFFGRGQSPQRQLDLIDYC